MKVKYLCYYDTLDSCENRYCVMSAKGKIDYIVSVLNKLGYSVQLVSASHTKNRKFYRSKIEELSENTNLVLFSTFGYSTPIAKIASRVFTKIQLLMWLILNVKNDDLLIVYHSLGYMDIVDFIRKVKKVHIIMEVEEIYSDVLEREGKREKEISYLSKSDGFIIPTELLKDTIAVGEKPTVVIYGSYKKYPFVESRTNSQEVQVVYAGFLDISKGAWAAIESAQYLPSNYTMHILGFGSDRDLNAINCRISELASQGYHISYDGMLKGDEFDCFLTKCDIGLCTQDPNAQYSNTSFPSKVLTYLSHGLKVVAIEIPSLKESHISNCLYFYKDNNAKSIAEAIVIAAQSKECYGARVIEQLDDAFTDDIDLLLKNINKGRVE